MKHNQVKEPIRIPCSGCMAVHEGQSVRASQSRNRLWTWFDRITRYSLIPKIIMAMTLVTAAAAVIGYGTNSIKIENHPIFGIGVLILLFCEGVFLLGLFLNIPYDYNYDVVANPAFKDFAENAWHEREINQS